MKAAIWIEFWCKHAETGQQFRFLKLKLKQVNTKTALNSNRHLSVLVSQGEKTHFSPTKSLIKSIKTSHEDEQHLCHVHLCFSSNTCHMCCSFKIDIPHFIFLILLSKTLIFIGKPVQLRLRTFSPSFSLIFPDD